MQSHGRPFEKKRQGAPLSCDGVVFWNGELSSLKHFKDDGEIRSGNECGLSFEKFQDFPSSDVIEAYEIVKEKKTLD